MNATQLRDQDTSKLNADIEEYYKELRKRVNTKLNVFSRISEIIEQSEPFDKTPTQKIKRYLYT